MNSPKESRFNWSQSYGRDRFYTQYKPKVRIYSFFFLILPWFNLFLLAFAYVYFSHALSIVPGERVNLPVAKGAHAGLKSGFIITARSIYSRDADASNSEGQEQASLSISIEEQTAEIEKLPSIIVFFKDERFNLSMPHRYASFEAKLRQESQQHKQKAALIYADKNIVLADAMKLLDVLRNAGLENVCFVEEAK
jgi:biopolymer transport protein ExbD